MVKKELTHIYTLNIHSGQVDIGAQQINGDNQLELFSKQLPLTSDLKRLPFLLGVNMLIWSSPDIHGEIIAGGVEELTVTGVLLNGSYTATFANMGQILADERAVDDIIGICTGLYMTTGTAGQSKSVEIQNFAWDFEGLKVLYDTITLLIFIQTEVNVSGSAISGSMIQVICNLEIDWRPMSVKDVQEFIMEHIYARQGD